jgi:hypothetical protein
MLVTPLDTLAYLVVKAREFDAEVPPEGTEDGSNAADDLGIGILEDTADNPTEAELTSALRDLNDDQIAEILALVWLGRGDFSAAEWQEALAAAVSARNERTVGYLLQTPLLGDLIEQGLDELGYSLIDEESRL